MLLLVFGGLVFLFPVASYCLFLAMVNNRPQPTMISGPWDFAGVLFATSGFLLVGGPTALGAFHTRYRLALAQGQLPNPGLLFASGWEFWALLWGLYFVVIVGGAIVILLRRRTVTVIYNIEVDALHDVLFRALGQLRLQATRVGNRLFLTPASDAPALTSAGDAIQAAPGYPAGPTGLALSAGAGILAESQTTGRKPFLVLDPFPAMRNISLRWRPGNETLRQDLEAELSRELAHLSTEDNPVAGWFLTVASCLFGALFLGLVGFIIFLTRR